MIPKNLLIEIARVLNESEVYYGSFVVNNNKIVHIDSRNGLVDIKDDHHLAAYLSDVKGA